MGGFWEAFARFESQVNEIERKKDNLEIQEFHWRERTLTSAQGGSQLG